MVTKNAFVPDRKLNVFNDFRGSFFFLVRPPKSEQSAGGKEQIRNPVRNDIE